MREAAFVKQNMARWQEYEKLLNSGVPVLPDKRAEIFIQLTDDLSFARTQYADSETAHYLNHLSAKIHANIYRNKKEDRSRFITFWTRELPELLNTLRRPMLYAFLIFGLAAAIGSISVLNDDTFIRLILGDGYVNMTLENIEKGQPLGVYADSGELDMFFAITFNNIRVSFTAFAAGILLSVGTGFVLFRNGIMVGAFFTFFYQKNLLVDSIFVVMLHGTIELSAIVLAGAAGLHMGNAILFPKTYSRYDSFRQGAKDGLKLVMGLMPFFIIAGFIESFVTRYASMPFFIKAVIVVGSMWLIIFYFFIYPLRFRHGTKN
ncbi:MAG: stage II sporulation protein M [Cyclobacteriaceae bacterium]|nr:stage II sporulation protein M [Cyclobacteriaceae bacterium]